MLATPIPAAERCRPFTFVLVNDKGGVGKTATAYATSALLARTGRRVLLIELDPQGNTSQLYLGDARHEALTMLDVLTGDRATRAPLADAVQPTRVPGLDIVAANPAMAYLTKKLVQDRQLDWQMSIRKALTSVADRYDYVLIDLRPGFDEANLAAFLAAPDGRTRLLVPLTAEVWPMQSLRQFTQVLGEFRADAEDGQPRIPLPFGILMTRYRAQMRLPRQARQRLALDTGETAPDGTVTRGAYPLLRTVIPDEAALQAQLTYRHAPGDPGLPRDVAAPRVNDAYATLTNELMDLCEGPGNGTRILVAPEVAARYYLSDNELAAMRNDPAGRSERSDTPEDPQ